MQQGIDFQAWIWANFLLQRTHAGAEFPGVTVIFLIDLLTEMGTRQITKCCVLSKAHLVYLILKLGHNCSHFC